MAKKAILTSAFIPVEPEEINAEWLYEVINQYRHLKEMSLVKEPDDLVSCEIAEKKSSKGRLSSTYLIDIKFKVIRPAMSGPFLIQLKPDLIVQVLMSIQLS